MVQRVICVVEDGTPRAPAVPPNSAVTLRLPIGETITLQLVLVYSNGAKVPIATGDVISLAIRKRPTDAQILTKIATHQVAEGPNRADVAIGPADLRSFPPGHYLADAWLVVFASGARFRALQTSRVILDPAIVPVP